MCPRLCRDARLAYGPGAVLWAIVRRLRFFVRLVLGRRRLQPTVLDLIELAANPLPLDVLKRGAGDWQEIDDGDDTTGGYDYAEPNKCECGLSWDVENADAFFNQKPNAQDIAALYATIDFPKTPSDACDPPCRAVDKGRRKRYRIYKNKKTGQFWLHCSKRVQWHCEKVEL